MPRQLPRVPRRDLFGTIRVDAARRGQGQPTPRWHLVDAQAMPGADAAGQQLRRDITSPAPTPQLSASGSAALQYLVQRKLPLAGSRAGPTTGLLYRASPLRHHEPPSSPFRRHRQRCRTEPSRPRPRHPLAAGCHSSTRARHPAELAGRPHGSSPRPPRRRSAAPEHGLLPARAPTAQLRRAKDRGLHRRLSSRTDCPLWSGYAATSSTGFGNDDGTTSATLRQHKRLSWRARRTPLECHGHPHRPKATTGGRAPQAVSGRLVIWFRQRSQSGRIILDDTRYSSGFFAPLVANRSWGY
jgi:hypothetical protein